MTSRRTSLTSHVSRSVLSVLVALGMSGCNALSRIENVGKAPDLAAIENPVAQAGYHPVSLPMPAPQIESHAANSLWRSGARSFFKDQRARQVGDILTVMIEIKDNAEIKNATTRKRTNSEDASAGAFLGLEAELAKKFPQAISNTNLVDLNATTNNSGEGGIAREEEITLKVAALITQLLPNGNMVIQGRQEVRVNYEVRELLLAGVIRPEDIANDNTITSDKIAEARISYGGRGQITDVQQPRYGQQVFDILFPF